MAAGSVTVNRTPAEVLDRLRIILAAANCDVLEADEARVRFHHGAWLTQSAPLLPKSGEFRLVPVDGRTKIEYEVHLATAARVWLTVVGIVFFPLVFPPILCHRAIFYHPRRFAENILAGL